MFMCTYTIYPLIRHAMVSPPYVDTGHNIGRAISVALAAQMAQRCSQNLQRYAIFMISQLILSIRDIDGFYTFT